MVILEFNIKHKDKFFKNLCKKNFLLAAFFIFVRLFNSVYFYA